MSFTVTIGGVERAVDRKSFRASNVLTSRVDTCSFTLRISDPADKPYVGQEVIVEEGGERLFGGRVTVPGEKEPLPGQLVYEVMCIDYTKEGDKNLVIEIYPAGWTRGAIARDIVTKYCPGFTATVENVPDGPVMPEMRFDYKWPSECFTKLCMETGGDWYWNYYKGLRLFTSEDTVAPFDITDDGTGEHPADLVIAPDIQDVATRVYVRGGEYYGNSVSQTFKMDGVGRELPLGYKPKNLVVTLNGGAQTVAVDELLNQVSDPDWTYNFQEKLLKRGANKATPADGDLTVSTYNPLLPVRVVADDTDAQAKLGALMGNDGIFEATIVDPSLDSKEAARAAATAYLRQHANPLIQGGYSTLRSGLRAGMRQKLRLAGRNVEMEVLIGEVTREALSGDRWRYRVTFATYLMGIEDLIRQLVQAQKQVPPRDDETLDIIIGLKDPLPPSDALTVTETADFRAIAGYSESGFCESAEQLAEGLGTALRFDGNDYVSIPSSPALKPAQFTLEAKIHWSISQKNKIFVSKYSGTPCEYELIFDTNGYLAVRSDATGAAYYATDNTLSDTYMGQTVHVTGVYDGALKLYVNGVLKGTSAAFTRDTSRTDPLNFGRRPYTGAEGYFTGTISEVRLWSVARTAEEIVGSLFADLTGAEVNLAGLWKLDAGSGTVAADSAANGNDGTITGATWITRLDSYPAQADVTTAPGDVTLYRPALSYSRSSVAYNPETGAQVASGTPRYVRGKNLADIDWDDYAEGTAPAWVASVGSWAVETYNGEKALRVDSLSGLNYAVLPDEYVAPRYMRCNVMDAYSTGTANYPHPGIIFAWQDADNHDAIYMREGSNDVIWYKRRAGAVTTEILTSVSIAVSTWYPMEVFLEADGRFSVWFNGTQIASRTGALTGTTRIGFWAHDTGIAYFGDLSVGQAVLVEEGVTNLLTANQSNVETDTTGFAAVNATISRDTTEKWEGLASLKVVTNGVTSDGADTTSVPCTASQTYTLSVYLKGSGSVKLFLEERDASDAFIGQVISNQIALTSSWKRYSVTRAFGASGVKARLSVRVDPTPQAITFYMDGLQLEQKAYATSWQIGGTARAVEVPTAAIPALPNSWIAYWHFKPDWASTVGRTVDPVILEVYLDSNNRFALGYAPASDRFYLYGKKGGAIHGQLYSAVKSFAGGDWISLAFAVLSQPSGDLAAGRHMWIKLPGGAVEHITDANITNIAAATLEIGCFPWASGFEANGAFDDLHLLYRAPVNNAEVEGWLNASAPAEPTADTVVLVPFDGSLTALYPSEATITTVELDLGDPLPARPVLLFPTLDSTSPAGTSATVTRYRMKANPGDAWGAWETPTNLPSGGFLTLTAPLRYIQLEVQLGTTDSTQTPILIGAGVFD